MSTSHCSSTSDSFTRALPWYVYTLQRYVSLTCCSICCCQLVMTDSGQTMSVGPSSPLSFPAAIRAIICSVFPRLREPHRRGRVADQQCWGAAAVGRDREEVVAVRVDEGFIVEPLDLIVDRALLGNRVIGKGREVQNLQPPAALVADPALEGDLFPVGRERRGAVNPAIATSWRLAVFIFSQSIVRALDRYVLSARLAMMPSSPRRSASSKYFLPNLLR